MGAPWDNCAGVRPSASCRGPVRASDESSLAPAPLNQGGRLVGVWAVRITGSSSRAANRRCETPYLGLFEKWAVNKVPIGRYMAFVGSLLLAMLFIADWLLPIGPTHSVTSGRANKPTIRIKSDPDHKWPERIAFDTSAPTIVVQLPPLVTGAPVTNPQREAFALLSEPVPEGSETPLLGRAKRKLAK